MLPEDKLSLPRNPFRLGGRSPHIRPLFPEGASGDASAVQALSQACIQARLADPQAPGTGVDQPLHFHARFAEKYTARALSRCDHEEYQMWMDSLKVSQLFQRFIRCTQRISNGSMGQLVYVLIGSMGQRVNCQHVNMSTCQYDSVPMCQ